MMTQAAPGVPCLVNPATWRGAYRVAVILLGCSFCQPCPLAVSRAGAAL
jgi:hypothetical protein